MRSISEQGLIRLLLWGLLFIYMSCSSNDDPGPVDCNASSLAVSFTSTDPTSCAVNNGTITATAAGGEGPFQYALDANGYASSADFKGLGAGTYQLKLKDKNGCERSTSVVLKPFGSTLAAVITVTDSGCNTSNGAISIDATGGTGPYTYTINNGAVSSQNNATVLAAGSYVVKVTDDTGCSVTETVKVLSGIRLSVEIKAIIDASCAVTGCHISGGAAPISFTSLANIQSSASLIKTKTASGEMPKGGAKLSQEKLDAIACWVDDGAPNN